MRHGYGKFTSVANGQSVVYEGFWKDGAKHGTGKMTLAHHDTIEGKWSFGVLDGPVLFKFSEGSPWNDPEY